MDRHASLDIKGYEGLIYHFDVDQYKDEIQEKDNLIQDLLAFSNDTSQKIDKNDTDNQRKRKRKIERMNAKIERIKMKKTLPKKRNKKPP